MGMWIAFILVLWVAWSLLVRWIVGIRPRGDDGYASAVVRLFQLYARYWQRTTYEGLEHIPGALDSGSPVEPVIVVCNHTAGIDPVLVQAVCPFEVRWMMALDMRLGFLEGAWRFGRILFVDRENPTGMELREAMAHVKSGGALGVFPEGQIARPPIAMLPFREGVGLIVRRTGAMVLPVAISGTPRTRSAWGSIWRRSRAGARVRVLEPRRFGRDTDAKAIAAELERAIAAAMGASG